MFFLLSFLACFSQPFEGRGEVKIVFASQEMKGLIWVKEPDKLHFAVRDSTGRVVIRLIQNSDSVVIEDLTHGEHLTASNMAFVASASNFPMPANWIVGETSAEFNEHFSRKGNPTEELVLSSNGVEVKMTIVNYVQMKAPKEAFNTNNRAHLHESSIDEVGLFALRAVLRSLNEHP